MIGILALTLSFGCRNGSNDTVEDTKNIKKHLNEELSGVLNGHEWVDLGLPSGLKWATCNIGASEAEEFGDYYAWGETEPKSEYTSINSLTYKVSFRKLKKSGIIDESGILAKEYDAASVNWGEGWRMPTIDEYQELISNCNWNFASFNGVNGYLVTGPNNKNIFLPAAAFQQNTTIENVGDFGDYWSSSVVKELSGVAHSLGYSSKSHGRRRYARYAGRTIRPVTD
ncbi:MAG: hypothetical protein K2K75_08830 [Muribaculaceae bacterium]|nr:hypothetical protein [Muribaculaceae bacterium]